MGKITRHGGASVREFAAPTRATTPKHDPRRDARLETFAAEAPPEPQPEEPAPPRKRARKAAKATGTEPAPTVHEIQPDSTRHVTRSTEA